jgi:hypothetical protein
MIRTSRLSWLILALAIFLAVPPTIADSYLVYSDGGVPPGASIFLWGDCMPFCDFGASVSCDTPEGGASMRLHTNVWGGWGIFPPTAEPVNLSAFESGEMSFFVKSPFDLVVGFDCKEPATATYAQSISQHGWVNVDPPTWQEITIPVCDFFPGGDCAPHAECLANIAAPFHVNLPVITQSKEFLVDYIRWNTANTHTGASLVAVDDVDERQLMVNGEPFVVNGMAYNPMSIGENWQAAWRDRPDRYLVDFPLIAATGANAVRLYAPVLTTAMLDAAWSAGLYVIPNFGVNPDQLACDAGRTFMQDRMRETVLDWKDHPAILFWLVGNEVNINLGSTDLCVDWFPQLDALAQTAHAVDSSHPVGTANAGVADICVPGCSDDTSLPNVDLWGTQVYRGCQGLDTTFTDYLAKTDCARPLIVTEFGVDAWDSRDPAEDQDMQATCLGDQLDDADQALAVRTPGGVSSGQVVFSWADEWWKAECDLPAEWNEHDTCTSFENFAYDDVATNEEWWGVVGLSSVVGEEDVRILRTAYDRVGESWHLGAVCNLDVVNHDAPSGNTTISFDPATGSTDHTLYYGPLSAVSSYGYSGSVSGLGANGSSLITLPDESLFWVIAARNNGTEGCYGVDYPGALERPCSPGPGSCSVPPAANRTCVCSGP